jgi:hypothetical protein
MINGTEYAWEDIQVVLPGSILPRDGVSGIEYTYKKEHTNIHARGAKPVAGGRGKEDAEGSITILQSLLEALQAALPPGKNLVHLPGFTVTVAYAPEGGVATIDQLIFVRFTEVKKGMKSGDPNQEITLPIIIGDINYNVT